MKPEPPAVSRPSITYEQAAQRGTEGAAAFRKWAEEHKETIHEDEVAAHARGFAAAYQAAWPELEALRALVARFREALEPFAALWHPALEAKVGGDDAAVFQFDAVRFTVGDVRRARAVLEQPHEGERA